MGLEFRVEGSLLFLGHEVGDTAQPAHVLLLLFVQVRHHDEVGEVAVDAANFQVLVELLLHTVIQLVVIGSRIGNGGGLLPVFVIIPVDVLHVAHLHSLAVCRAGEYQRLTLSLSHCHAELDLHLLSLLLSLLLLLLLLGIVSNIRRLRDVVDDGDRLGTEFALQRDLTIPLFVAGGPGRGRAFGDGLVGLVFLLLMLQLLRQYLEQGLLLGDTIFVVF
mmetsp:Transcript_8676/g.13763  ORF Transcript_8676/g.13763 Transcript_8676/m.13763 type:complete len:219 (+) Transcript_8676:416-1072(+)